jgi:hypothetical protein
MRRHARRISRCSLCLALLLALGLATSPTVAAADDGSARDDRQRARGILNTTHAVLYELNEQAQFTPTNHRVATSGLEGTADRGTPLCPEGLMAYAETFFALFGITVQDAPRCAVVAFGHSDLNLATLGGTIDGDFYVVVNSDKTNLLDPPELVMMVGQFQANIQVSDRDGLIIDVLPGATMTPTSVLPGFPGGLPPAAPFTGKFRLPFKLDGTAVYKTDSGESARVRQNERALGRPLVRLDISFGSSFTSRFDSGDDEREVRGRR